MAIKSLSLIGVMFVVILGGCSSENYRKGTKKVDTSKVEAILAEINSDGKKSDSDNASEKLSKESISVYEGLDLVKFKALSQDNNTIIYFAEGPNKGFGAVNSIFGVADASVFGLPFNSIDAITDISVLLLSGHIEGVKTYSLLLKSKYGSEQFAQVLDSFNVDLQGDILTINFNLDGRIIQAVTTDLSTHDKHSLASTIQLKLYSRDSIDAQALYEGKIAKLILVKE